MAHLEWGECSSTKAKLHTVRSHTAMSMVTNDGAVWPCCEMQMAHAMRGVFFLTWHLATHAMLFGVSVSKTSRCSCPTHSITLQYQISASLTSTFRYSCCVLSSSRVASTMRSNKFDAVAQLVLAHCLRACKPRASTLALLAEAGRFDAKRKRALALRD